MNTITTRRLTAATMAGAAILAGAGFTALGSIFNYPKVLQSPAAGILAAYREHDTAISAWFLVLVLSAALLGPRRRPRPAGQRPHREVDRGHRHRRGAGTGHRPVEVGAVRPRPQ